MGGAAGGGTFRGSRRFECQQNALGIGRIRSRRVQCFVEHLVFELGDRVQNSVQGFAAEVFAAGSFDATSIERSIPPVITSIASIAPAGADCPISNRSTKNDFASSSEPLIATRIERLRTVHACGSCAGVDATSLAADADADVDADEADGGAVVVDETRGGDAGMANAALQGGREDERRVEKGGIDETSAASMGGILLPGEGAGDAARGGRDSVRVSWARSCRATRIDL